MKINCFIRIIPLGFTMSTVIGLSIEFYLERSKMKQFACSFLKKGTELSAFQAKVLGLSYRYKGMVLGRLFRKIQGDFLRGFIFWTSFLLIITSCQPTNTLISKKDRASNIIDPSVIDSQVLVVRITDSNKIPLSGSALALNVSESLSLRAGLFRLDNTFVDDATVRWNLKTSNGGPLTGLTCGSSPSITCNFTPPSPGSVAVEVTLSDRPANAISVTDLSPTIVVSAPSTPASITSYAGDNQVGVVNTALSQSLTVLVRDAFARPVPGVSVDFSVAQGGGSLQGSSTVVTDTDGKASIGVVLGTAVGTNNNEFEANVGGPSGLVAAFQASAFPGAVASLELQTTPSATYSQWPFYQQPTVVAKDGFGNIVTTLNEPLTVSVQSGNGNLSGNITKNFINGVVTFTDLAYSAAETGVVLRFATSTTFVDSATMDFITPTNETGITPDDVNFGFKVTENPGSLGRQQSAAVTISGLTNPITVSVAGPGNPKLRLLPGGSEVSALFNVTNTNSVAVVADAPIIPGVNVVTIILGGRTETFEVRYADSTKIAYAFVTSDSKSATGANDAGCVSSASAAGYGGAWISLTALTTASLQDLTPYQWGQLKRLDGKVIAESWDQLWQGTLSNPINISELGTINNASVFTGALDSVTKATTNNSCSNWTSTTGSPVQGYSSFTNSQWMYQTGGLCNIPTKIYCISDPSGPLDTSPNTINFKQTIVTSNGSGRQTSNAATISGLNTPVSASISGTSGNPAFTVNGGPEVTTATVQNGDVIQLLVDAPTTAGSTHLTTFTVGSSTLDWRVRYADPNLRAYVFVSNGTWPGRTLGGLNGAHANCQAAATAAGLSGQWQAMLTERNAGHLYQLIPWNWGSLHRLDGELIANQWQDLWDGSISQPINITEFGTIKNGNVWTGVISADGTKGVSTSDDAVAWNSGGTVSARIGQSFAVNGQWITNGTIDSSLNSSLYCISDPSAGYDTIPNDVNFLKEATEISGERKASLPVDIKGVNTAIAISVSGSQGNPQLRINGGAEVSSGTVVWGDSVEVLMDAPTSTGTLHTATIVLGSLTKSWQLGYADPARVARIFVSNSTGTGNLGGLIGADAQCNQSALAAGFTAGSWKALLSDSATNARDRIPFNWGQLQLLNGTVVADSWQELWSGTIQSPIYLMADGVNSYAGPVFSSTSTSGLRRSSNALTSDNCNNWGLVDGSLYSYTGQSGAAGPTWIQGGSYTFGCGTNVVARIYCVEDLPAGNDWSPASFSFNYLVFQTPSQRLDSNTITISGVSGAPAPVVLTGIQGSPTFKINGGPEVTTGSVVNGDSLTLVITAPASLNQSHKVEVQVGTSALVPWRIWTGDGASGIKKRVFITSTSNLNGALGGVAGADNICQTAAANNSNLNGMNWKAILSGDSTQEGSWAINRISYDWAELWTFNADGSLKDRVFSAGQIWNGSPPEAAFNLNEMSVPITTNTRVLTNTTANGRSRFSGLSSCTGFTAGNAESTSGGYVNDPNWLTSLTSTQCSGTTYRIYCIQQ